MPIADVGPVAETMRPIVMSATAEAAYRPAAMATIAAGARRRERMDIGGSLDEATVYRRDAAARANDDCRYGVPADPYCTSGVAVPARSAPRTSARPASTRTY